MTQYPAPPEQRVARQISGHERRIKVLEQRASSLAATVQILAPLAALGLGKVQALATMAQNGNMTFLQGLAQLVQPGWYPLVTDPGTGSTWQAGERDYPNSSINSLNELIQALERQGFMAT